MHVLDFLYNFLNIAEYFVTPTRKIYNNRLIIIKRLHKLPGDTENCKIKYFKGHLLMNLIEKTSSKSLERPPTHAISSPCQDIRNILSNYSRQFYFCSLSYLLSIILKCSKTNLIIYKTFRFYFF